MGKEVSHSDWLFVCKLKTNPRTLLGYTVTIVSKIQLVIYYQCCVLIG